MIETNRPNYDFAQREAWNVLKQYSTPQLPIKLTDIIVRIPNLKLISYTDFSRESGFDVDTILENVNSDDGTLWNRNDGKSIILFNDTISNAGQIRFTIAHELGHFFLKHNEPIQTPQLIADDAIAIPREEEYKVDETEANYFAKSLLAPIPLILDIGNKVGRINIEMMAHFFEISFTAAEYVIDNMNNLKQHGFYPIDSRLSDIFGNAVKESASPYLVTAEF